MPELSVELIRAYISIQRHLLDALRSKYPTAKDLVFLLDFPVSGEISVDGETWKFARHGAGIKFASSSGVVVDVHRGIGKPDEVDAWRVLQYLESCRAGEGDSYDEVMVESELADMARNGSLTRLSSTGRYRM